MIRKIVSLVLLITAAGAVLFTLVAFLGPLHWFLDLTSHFRVQYAAVLGMCTLGFTFLKMKKWTALAGAAFLVNWLVAGSPGVGVRPTDAAVSAGSELTVLSCNVNTANRQHRRVVELVQTLQPDVVGLIEINDRWSAAMKDALKDYLYKQELPREDNFGIGLYSRVPLTKVEIIYLGEAQVPSALATFELDGKPVTVLLTHTLPPVGAAYFAHRNLQLERIAEARADWTDHLIVAGDLNTTPWNAYFRKFLSATDLKDTRAGFGLQTTWPTMNPLMRIPLDHVLVSPEIITVDRRVCPDVGSDHDPVWVKLRI